MHDVDVEDNNDHDDDGGANAAGILVISVHVAAYVKRFFYKKLKTLADTTQIQPGRYLHLQLQQQTNDTISCSMLC